MTPPHEAARSGHASAGTPAVRRELQLAVVLCVVGAGLTFLAVRQDWISYPTSELTITSVRDGVRGTSVAALAQALSLVGLAGVVAIAATKRSGRVIVGALVALAGIGVVGQLVDLLASGLGHRLIAVGCSRLCIVSQEQYDASPTWAWPVLTLLGGALMAMGGLLVAVRGRRWAALSSSYEVPAARDLSAEPTHKATWDQLDAGGDPTA